LSYLAEVVEMAASKVAVTLDPETLREVDRLVREGHYRNRSKAVQAALQEMIRRRRRGLLAREAAKLDVGEEKTFAEEGLVDETWPEY